MSTNPEENFVKLPSLPIHNSFSIWLPLNIYTKQSVVIESLFMEVENAANIYKLVNVYRKEVLNASTVSR